MTSSRRRTFEQMFYCKENKTEISVCTSKKRPASHLGEELSEYEQKVQQNVAERQALLEQLNFDQIKNGLKVRKRIFKPKDYGERRQPSLRLQNLGPKEPKREATTVSNPSSDQRKIAPIRKTIGPLRMKSVLLEMYGELDYKAASNFMDVVSSLEAYGRNEGFSSANCSAERFTSWISSATLTINNTFKVVHRKIASLAVHPSEEKVIICAGAAAGELGVIDLSSEEENRQHLLLSPHSFMVNKVSFCQKNPDKLYSSSYDGTVLCADFQYKVFKKIFATTDVPQDKWNYPTMFDFINFSTIAISHGKACLSVIDQRQKLERCHYEKMHSGFISAVGVHPLKNDYVMTAGGNNHSHSVAIWDLRYLKKTPKCISSLTQKTCIYSAYFSPLTGSSVLLTNSNEIGILDSSTCEDELKCILKIPHVNSGGRWLMNFKAVWHPQREDVFAIGSWEYPRQIEMRDTTGSLLHAFKDDLSCICSVCTFHPSLPILVGANSSGKIFVYK